MKEVLVNLLGNTLIWQILLGIILLVLPSPLLRRTGDKVGDAIEGAGGVETRDVVYEFMYDFAEGLKSESYRGNKKLVSNDMIDKKLNKYNLSVGLERSKFKAKE